ncbi:MAG: hypothetical protein ACRDTE_13850 [Pseudonocardiaceae bacterium]
MADGFRGTGKTAVLSLLAELLDQGVPYAQLDLEANQHASVPQVLSALAFDLSRKCPRYGALRFPRLITGQRVMQLELERERALACRQVEHELKRKRGVEDTREEVLLAAASGVVDILGRLFGLPVKPPENWVRLVLKELLKRLPGQGVELWAYHDWYGHRDLRLSNDPLDVLVDLNRGAINSKNADPKDEDNQRWIDELLWAAFLADLRAEFSRRRAAVERWRNCVVLLDNADTELAHRFLLQLARIRGERAAGEQDDADPLTVVATSRGELLADVPDTDQADVTDADLGDVLGTGRSGPWWLQYRLPDLTENEVGRAVTDLAVSWGNNQRLTRVVYQLTGGHPASTRLVLDAIVTSAAQKWVDLDVILSQARRDASAQHPSILEDRMLGCLLKDLDAPTLRTLETYSAARDRERALELAGQHDLLVSGQVGYEQVLKPILWPKERSAGPTLLRRLLRRRLARRDTKVKPSWSTVYGWLRGTCQARGDEAGELYYALAEGDLGFVTKQLHYLLIKTQFDSIAWAELLSSVTEAPRRERCGQAPIDEVGTLVRSAELDESLTSMGRLIAALWIAADPFTDSRRHFLQLQIAADYSSVAQLCSHVPNAVFLEAAERHLKEAAWWD